MKLLIRDVDFTDAGILLAWRNEPEVRRYSRTQGIIPNKEHSDWLLKRLALSPTQPFWMFENETGRVGTTRFDFNSIERNFEVSITVNPELRGQGFGKKILDLAITNLIRTYPDVNLYAEIHQDNEASAVLFLGCGFKALEPREKFLIFERLANTN